MIYPTTDRVDTHTQEGIAIIGMSCIFPGAPDLTHFWTNIVSGVSSIRSLSENEWNPDIYLKEGTNSFSRIYCKRGGFITELANFDPLEFGIMPNSIAGTDPDQFLALKVANEALRDAGYGERQFNADRAEIILGRTSAPGAGALNLIQHSHTVDQVMGVITTLHPELDNLSLEDIRNELISRLRPCNSDTIPAVMPNVLAGRIANRLGFRGRNLILDAACASSLVAVETGVYDLLNGICDLALVGGIHINSTACFYRMFCELGALSRSGNIRPFDKDADGTILGEGLGMVVLKRLADALADKDRIYAVIRGIGSSSDGRTGSLLAPSIEGEALALRRAYEMAGISPQTVELLEAHGTGTKAGDVAEIRAIEQVFIANNSTEVNVHTPSAGPWCALGSVKSMIGHCQAASGIAGLIKTSLSLYHRVLPPTLGVRQPNPEIDWSKSPCYINTEARPWVTPEYREQKIHPRRAGVSAFGFGGVNSHVVLEESGSDVASTFPNLTKNWDTELCVFTCHSTDKLIEQVSNLLNLLENNPTVALADIAFSLGQKASTYAQIDRTQLSPYRLAIVTPTIDDLKDKLQAVQAHLLNKPDEPLNQSLPQRQAGIYYSGKSTANAGKVAFVAPGLGAAYPNMLLDLCLNFPEVRAVFDFVDKLAKEAGDHSSPSRLIFAPTNSFSPWGTATAASLAMMDSAVVTVLLAEWALFTLLSDLKVHPDTVLGCSTGEFAALAMSNAVNIVDAAETFYKLSTKVARSVSHEHLKQLRSINVKTDYASIQSILANLNEPVFLNSEMTQKDIVLSGTILAIETVSSRLAELDIEFHRLPLAIPYHTPLVSGVVNSQDTEVKALKIDYPEIEAWSCSTAETYPKENSEIVRITTDLFEKPIYFSKTIQRMYDGGVRTFIEVGPKGSLTPFISEILSGKPHLAVASNISTRSSITQIHHLLATLIVSGISVQLTHLFKRRQLQTLPLEAPLQATPKSNSSVRLNLSYPEIKPLSNTLSNKIRALSTLVSGLDCSSNPSTVESQVDFPSSYDGYNNDTDAVLQSYLKTIGTFHTNLMSAQQTVMLSYLEQTQEHLLEPPSYHPFLQDAQVQLSEKTVLVNRTLELTKDLYLLDHAIGGIVSKSSTINEKVHLLPLMVSLEIMAEAASLLAPGMVPVRITNVRAYRRIRVTSNGFPLRIEARIKQYEPFVVKAEVKRQGTSTNLNAKDDKTWMSCEIEFAATYPSAQPAKSLKLESERNPSISSQQLYAHGNMFHGPRMQSVQELLQIGKRGIKGRVSKKEISNWFASPSENVQRQSTLVDPLLLDNASQLVLFHLFEQQEPVSALLPFHIDEVQFYGSPASLQGNLTVQAQLNSITGLNTQADVEIIDQSGHLWSKITGIYSRRIILPSNWVKFIDSPIHTTLSSNLETLSNFLPHESNALAMWFDGNQLPEDEAVVDWLADYLLSTRERDYWSGELNSSKRKREWLMGRIAAKDAIRTLVQRKTGISICPADIEIQPSETGQPIVTGTWVTATAFVPLLSISHKDKSAVALVADPKSISNIGIDIESISSREPGFEEIAFTDGERKLLASMPHSKYNEMITRLWSAKEAAGKALGLGLKGNPHSIEIKSIDNQAQEVMVNFVSHETQADKRMPSSCASVKTVLLHNQILAISVG